MRATIFLTALSAAVLSAVSMSVPAGAQTVMYVRPPFAMLCDRLDYAKIAIEVASESNRTGKAQPYPPGCWKVRPSTPVTLLDQFDEYAFVGIGAGAAQPVSRAWVHIGALSETPESPPPRRRR
jgi:hypothetical protein